MGAAMPPPNDRAVENALTSWELWESELFALVEEADFFFFVVVATTGVVLALRAVTRLTFGIPLVCVELN
jgi:hypothetical protein